MWISGSKSNYSYTWLERISRDQVILCTSARWRAPMTPREQRLFPSAFCWIVYKAKPYFLHESVYQRALEIKRYTTDATDRQMDLPTDRQTDRPIYQQTGGSIDRQTNLWLNDRQTGRSSSRYWFSDSHESGGQKEWNPRGGYDSISTGNWE